MYGSNKINKSYYIAVKDYQDQKGGVKMYGTTQLKKQDQIKLIKKINKELQYLFSSISYGQYYRDYLQENVKEERKHQMFKPDNISSGLSVNEGGTFFAVKQVIEFLTNPKKAPDLEAYLYLRKAIYTAYALTENYRADILTALKDIDYNEVLKIDYCDLMQYDNQGNKLY